MKDIFICILLIFTILVLNQVNSNTDTINHLESVNSALKDKAEVSQRYTDAVEKALIQAWTDICLFKTDADLSDAYDAQYMECECVVANDMDKLAGGM